MKDFEQREQFRIHGVYQISPDAEVEGFLDVVPEHGENIQPDDDIRNLVEGREPGAVTRVIWKQAEPQKLKRHKTLCVDHKAQFTLDAEHLATYADK